MLVLIGCGKSSIQYHGKMNGIKFAWNNELESGVLHVPKYTKLSKSELINFSNCLAQEFGLTNITINSKHHFNYALPNYSLFQIKPGKELLNMRYSLEDLNGKENIVDMGLIFKSGWFTDENGDKKMVTNEFINKATCDLQPVNQN